jgi:hypothetical protein
MKPRIKGRYFKGWIMAWDGQWNVEIKWTHNDVNWFYETKTAIECAYQDIQVRLIK